MSTSTTTSASANSGSGEPPAKKAKLVEAGNPDPTKFLQEEIWMQVLGFVGPGHYAYVAGVNRPLKKWYKNSFEALQQPPQVLLHANSIRAGKRPAEYSDTFYRAAFSSEACANYWKESTAGDPLSDNQVCRLVAKRGTVEVFEWFQEQGHHFPLDLGTIRAAASGGQLDFIKYLRNKNCPWDEETCAVAAQNGHLECLKYLHENLCPWNEVTCKLAAGNGHLDCLKFAHEMDCPWDEDTCWKAAVNGHLHCLQYAHENGCPWDWRTCYRAAGGGHLECLQYIREEWPGGPWNEEVVRDLAQRFHHQHVLEWLAETQQEED